MKTIKVITLLSILFFAISAFINSSHLRAKEIQTKYSKITETYYIGKYEVSNEDYKRFLNGLLENNEKEIYNACLPDSLVWQNELSPLANYYFISPSFENYPVVAVSYENAIQYCKWLTKEYNSDSKKEFSKVLFRLPTKSEWTYAANGGDSTKIYTWNGQFMKDKRGFLCNFLRLGDNVITYNNSTKSYNVIKNEGKVETEMNRRQIAGSVNSFYPNEFGLYNMCGNVAEMVSEKGIAKGGSYDDPGYDVRIASEKNYTKQTKDIGFRVVMEILEK